MPDSSLIPPCVAAKVVFAVGIMCGWDFSAAWAVLNEWLTEEESLWLQSRIQLRALSYYSGWLPYFSAYYTGRLYWQLRNGDNLPLLRETFGP
ncbi:protein ybeU [Salmonella enterica subsp. enterica]|nr:protein ybeU [Salmonella enterica subsp. enterica]